MPITLRYSPEMAPEEGSYFGMDFSQIIPPGVGISQGQLTVIDTSTGLTAIGITVGDVQIIGRTLVAFIEAAPSAANNFLQFTWIAFATDASVWPRTALCLVAPTS